MVGITIMGILTYVVIICMSLLVHELGHFVFAKLFGVGVKEVSLGFPRSSEITMVLNDKEKKFWFPPRLKIFSWRETDFIVTFSPIGAYVMIANTQEDLDSREYGLATRCFDQLHAIPRLVILLGGVLGNWLLAALAFTILAAIVRPELGLAQILPTALFIPFKFVGSLANTGSQVVSGSPSHMGTLSLLSQLSDQNIFSGHSSQLLTGLLGLVGINILLIFFNLAPIFGVTDGGTIALILIEVLFRRRIEKIEARLTRIGLILFGVLILASLVIEVIGLVEVLVK